MNSNYGMIKGKITKFETENQTINESINKKKTNPHYNLTLNCNGILYLANINVLSRNPQSPDLKAYFTNDAKNLNSDLGSLAFASTISNGVYKNLDVNQSIDYLRGNYIDLSKLVVLTESKELEELVLFYTIDKYIREAKQNNYDVCLWGNLYEDSSSYKETKLGIHDIHMNQGNVDPKDNSIWSDGLLSIYDNDQLKFVCLLAFSGQCTKTDDNGNCC